MTLFAEISPRIAAPIKKTRAARGRLIFAFDATASREATWDIAVQLQAAMFEEAASIGVLREQTSRHAGIVAELENELSELAGYHPEMFVRHARPLS